MLKLTQEQQNKIVLHVRETFSDYETKSQNWRDRMTRIYKWVTTFRTLWQSRETGFKVNKLHEIENRILPRIMSKNPKPIVTYQKDDYITNPDLDVSEITDAVEDRLEEIYCKQDMIESLRLRAKGGIRYWLCFAKLTPKYRIARSSRDEQTMTLDEAGNPTPVTNKKVKEEVYEQYTWIDIKSWSDMYFDPTYTRLEDMPSIIDISRNIRMSYFTKNPKKYMNVDMLVQCCAAAKSTDYDWYSRRVQEITGLSQSMWKIMQADKLDIKCFYWLYDITENEGLKNERMYEFWTVNDTILVYADEITVMPYEDFRVFEDTETFFATGLLEPILGLQDEMNWKKNRASEYVNKMLKPDYIRSPASGIDPRKVNQWHWNIIVTPRWWQEALLNFVQMPMRELNSSYFQEQNDIERQIQAASFTINTGSPLTEQSLTQTATGAKIQNFETDAVTGEIRKHFEEALVRLSYKILQSEFEIADDVFQVRSRGEEDTFWSINKEALRNAVEKYEIKIQAWSSSYDDQDSRRNDAIAQWNIALQALQAGVPVNMKKLFENVVATFPNMDLKNLFEQQVQTTDMLWQPAPQLPAQQSQAPTAIPMS